MAKRNVNAGNAFSAPSSNDEIERSLHGKWRETSTAAQCLSHLCLSEQFSDTSFTFSAYNSVKLPVHKFVLIMRSEIFEAMFDGLVSEKGETVHVPIEDVKPNVMKSVLRFVYSDNPDIDENNVFPCLDAANKFKLPGLVKQCSNFLENRIDAYNVLTIHEQATLYEIKTLQDRCLVFIGENATGVLSSPGFLKISHEALLSILKSEELTIDEIDVFEAALRWAKYKCVVNNKSRDGRNVRNQLGEAFFEIRFTVIPNNEFLQVVAPSGILFNEEIEMFSKFNEGKRTQFLEHFRQQRRQGTPITVDTMLHMPYEKNIGKCNGCFLHLQGCNVPNYMSQSHAREGGKSLKLKSVTGPFVRNVKEIYICGNITIDYKIKEDKITFINPINISINIEVQFYFRHSTLDSPNFGKAEKNHLTYIVEMKKNVRGQDITITNVPEGLETISFVWM